MNILQRNKISDFSKIIKFEHSQRGDFKNLEYKPTFKSSAIFFFICNNYIDTKISFLNYWSIKNFNHNVSCLYTLRNQKGKKILRDFFKIKKNIYSFSIKDLIKKDLSQDELTGSIEFEIYSNNDLKFSYPAINAIYETDHGISLIHTNQRIMSDIEDNLENESLNASQTGFDIYCDIARYSFLAAINGPIEIKNKDLKIVFFNKKGQKTSNKIHFKSIKPFEVMVVNLDNFKNLRKFFNGEKGFCKVEVPTKNIFNRILAGTFSRDKKKITTTHSYYDCSAIKDFISLKTSDEHSCFIPFNIINDIDLDVVIYPIFSRCDIIFDLESIDKNGQRKMINKNILEIKKNFKSSITLSINDYIKNEKNCSNYVYSLSGRTKNKKIPTRMTYGFNYKQKSFGSNICDSMKINDNKNNKGKGFYWGPAFNSKKIETILALSSINKNHNIDYDLIKLKLYDEERILCSKKIKISNFEALNLNLKKIIKSIKKRNISEILWFTIETPGTKNFTCKHVHKSIYGHISADHSF